MKKKTLTSGKRAPMIALSPWGCEKIGRSGAARQETAGLQVFAQVRDVWDYYSMRFGSHRRFRSSQTSSLEAAPKEAPSVGGPGVVASAKGEASSPQAGLSESRGSESRGSESRGTARTRTGGMSMLLGKFGPWTGLSTRLSKFLKKIGAPFLGAEQHEVRKRGPQVAGSSKSGQPVNSRLRMLARVRSVFLTALWFMPGAFFIAIGLSVAFAPQLLMSAIAGFCVFFGFASFGLAWKFIQLKNRVEKVAQSFETRIMVQAIPHGKLADPEERVQELAAVQTKKILFH